MNARAWVGTSGQIEYIVYGNETSREPIAIGVLLICKQFVKLALDPKKLKLLPQATASNRTAWIQSQQVQLFASAALRIRHRFAVQ